MAGTEIGSLYYDLNIDDKNLKRQLDEADKSVKGFGERANQYWGSATAASQKLLLGVAAVGAGLVAFGVSSVKAYNESQMALTQLDAVLKSTGGTAGVTRDAAIALSKEIQRTTSVSDETALAVENMGLTFTAIHKEIFPQTTKAAIDMATALNHGIAPSAEQAADTMKLLGKALQDPDAGLGALHRVGVNVNELQKQFVGVNDVATKQKLILAELGREFGGSASAQAKTFAGRVAQIKNSFNDLQEQVGETISKALGPVADAFGRWIQKVNDAGGLLSYFNGIVDRHRSIVYALAGAIVLALIPAIIAMGTSLWTALEPLLPFIAIGAALGLIIKALADHFGGLSNLVHIVRDEIKKLYEYLDPIFRPAIEKLVDIWNNTFLPALKRFWAEYGPQILTVLKDLGIAIGVIWIVQLLAAIKILGFLFGEISHILDGLTLLKQMFVDSAHFVADKANESADAIRNFYTAVRNKVVDFLEETRNKAVDIFNHIKSDIDNWATDVESRFSQWSDNIVKKNQEFHHDWLGTIQSALTGAHDALKDYVDSERADLSRVLTDMATSISNWAQAVPGEVMAAMMNIRNSIVEGWQRFYLEAKTALDNTLSAVANWGISAYNNIGQAVSNMWNSLSNFFTNLPQNITNWLRGALQSIQDWFTNLANSVKPSTDKAGDDIARNVHDSVRNGLSAPARIRQIGDTLMSIIGLVILAVAFYFVDAGVRLVRAIFDGINSAMRSIAQALIGGVESGLAAVQSYYGRFVDAGYGLIRAFANGVRGAAAEAVGAANDVLQKVRNLLPFSDAKEGPLSDLTLSGRRFSETFATGIRKAAGNVQSAVQDTLSTPMAAMNGSLTVGGLAMPTAPQAASQTASNNNTTTRYGDTVVNIDTINDRQDADYLIGRIDRNTRLENMGLSPSLQGS